MENKKIIEEMAKVVQRDMCGDRPCEECNYHGFKTKILPRYCEVYLIAEKLYKAGYRKTPENAVVLTREEYEWLTCCFGKFEEIMNDIKKISTQGHGREVCGNGESKIEYSHRLFGRKRH